MAHTAIGVHSERERAALQKRAERAAVQKLTESVENKRKERERARDERVAKTSQDGNSLVDCN